MAEAPVRVPGVEARAGKFPGPSLIPALNAIQERVGWLPREELVTLSREVRRPLYEIEGLVSFYPHFRTEPPKQVELRVCHDLSCWLRGGDERIAALARAVRRGRRGRAGRGLLPRPLRHRARVHGERGPGPMDDAPAPSTPPSPRPPKPPRRTVTTATPTATTRSPAAGGIAASPGRTTRTRPPADRYAVLRSVLAGRCDTADIITALKDAGLRGMGGAGFPAGRKWDLVAAQQATPRYVICNADESEPGTFKDREILATQPYLVLEGLLLGMLAVGAEEGWVFIRHEYGPEEQVIRAGDRVAARYRPDRPGRGAAPAGGCPSRSSPPRAATSSARSRRCIECMEGHRGEPRNKPPFPGTYGLHGQPTLMNSVETFAHVPVIATRGADWWNAAGRPRDGAMHAG